MSRKSMLLAGFAITAAVIVSATPVSAKTIKHKTPAKAAPSAESAEIQALKAQVQALTSRLDAQESAQRSTQATADAAQATATASQAQAQAATTQAQASQTAVAAATEAVPTQIKDAIAKQPKAAPSWADGTVISGRMYFDASNIVQDTNGVRQPSSGTGFNVKRIYLGIDHKFDNIFSANITTDISNVVGSTSNANFNASATPGLVGRGFYIKKAYLQAKLDPAFIVRFGAADLPWVPYDEGIYGFRHIENVIVERAGIGTSADWGVHILGDLAGGILSYQVSIVDGAGYRNVKVTKTVDIEGRLSAAYKNFFAAVGGYTGKLGNDVEGTTTFNSASRLNALAGYKNKIFTIGAEYYWAKNYNNSGLNYITSNISDTSEGYSAFGNFNFTPKIALFGRYDWVKPRKSAVPTLHDDYFNFGLQYSPAKIVDLALVYKRDKAVNGTLASQNGTIGGSINGTYDEFGLFGQFKF